MNYIYQYKLALSCIVASENILPFILRWPRKCNCARSLNQFTHTNKGYLSRLRKVNCLIA